MVIKLNKAQSDKHMKKGCVMQFKIEKKEPAKKPAAKPAAKKPAAKPKK